MTVNWKQVDGHQNYIISQFGEIKNEKTKRTLKQVKNAQGYYVVNLSQCGCTKTERVHDLMARTFLNKENGEQTHHKNSWKWCNCRWNLETIEQKEHLQKHRIGTKHSQQTKRKIRQNNIGKHSKKSKSF